MVADPNDYEPVANPNDYEPVAQPAPVAAPIIPRSGAQNEGLEAREFLRTSPDQVRGTGDQPILPIPRIPQQQGVLAQLGAGAVNAASGVVEMAETPQLIASLPIAPARLTQAIFGGQALSDIKNAYEEAAQPDTTIQKGLELGGRALTDAIFGVGMVHGSVGDFGAPKLTESIFGKEAPKAEPEAPPQAVKDEPQAPPARLEAPAVEPAAEQPAVEPQEQVADTGAKPVSETNIYFGDKGEVLGKSTGGERSILPDVEFEKSAAAVEHTHPEVSPASATDINSFVQNPLKQMRVALPDGTKWMFEKPENWRYPRELSGHDVKMLVREVHQQELQGDPNRTFKQIYHDQNAAVAEKLGLTFHGEDTGSKPDVPVSTEGEATVALGNTKEITPTAETQTTRSEVTQEGQAAPPEKPPVQTEPTGINTERLQQIYGNDSVLVTKGHSPDEFQRIGQSDKRDPYAVLGKSQQSGIAVPDDVPVMRAEHQRLLNVARDAYGTPQYNELAQQAVDFANAIKTVAHGPASEIFRSLQDVDKPRFDSPADFENIVRERMNRESTPQEKQVFQKASDDVVNSRNESSSSATEAQTRLREYKPNETISFDEAVDHVREQIAALTKNC